MQRSALCRSRRELSNAYFLAKFGVDTAENPPVPSVFEDNPVYRRRPPRTDCLQLGGMGYDPPPPVPPNRGLRNKYRTGFVRDGRLPARPPIWAMPGVVASGTGYLIIGALTFVYVDSVAALLMSRPVERTTDDDVFFEAVGLRGSLPELKGSIGEGPNQTNYSDQSSVRIPLYHTHFLFPSSFSAFLI